MAIKSQALIIGAGPSGLALAYGLGDDVIVLEKEAAVGGLCRSIEYDGGVFDIGGHSFHTPHPEVRALVEDLLDEGLYLQKRDARIYSTGVLIPYPFQQNFDQIPDPEIVAACQSGLENAAGHAAEAKNFEEYILRKFGSGIAEYFMLPYNRKLWARDITGISCEWISERVAAPKGEKQTFELKGGQRKPLQSDTYVGYPKTGGYEEIYRSFVPHLPDVRLNSGIVRIDPGRHLAVTEDGQEFEWEFLVSTMPLPVLTRLVAGTPSDVVAASDQLEYMSLRVELLLVGRRLETSIQRIYVADPGIYSHKIALNHNSSETLRARPHHAIMAEVSLSPEKPVDVTLIAQNTIDFLCEIGVLESQDDVIWQDHVDVKYAYPVYTHRRPELVQHIKDWMVHHDMYVLGRFGDWEYINSDKCVMKGLVLAQELREKYPAL